MDNEYSLGAASAAELGSLTSGRIKFRHLQCFLAVTQFGSVQRAADSLSITQPAVSKTIAELESILGVRLFERGRRGAEPTREGRLFAPHAAACVGALREGVDELSRHGVEHPGTVSLSVLPTVAPALLPPTLAAFRAQWPGVSVKVWTGSNGQLLERLKSADTDLVVGRLSEPEGMVGMTFEQLYREPLTVVVRNDHPLVHESNVTASLLARFPIVVPPFGTLIRQSAESVLTAFGAQASSSLIETLSVSLGRALALHNDAVWFVPSSVVEHDVALKLLARLPMPFAGADEPIGLILRHDRARSPALDGLIDAIRDAGREREAVRIGMK
ncbi:MULTISPECIES: pca operon transcription factor PcaQ [Burkholderiaceae]|uniref:LysR family transcriptional regulator YdcI n=1 Tax=Caballeronia sordidicola TaxID=196367 RepID=A0A242N272_CABSO|nr:MULTISPECIES: pca operon transcription factor PcaQ [Burkholderiaceae]AME26484.1 LysR family transcriptional regulator [Burkholderia sp. PAMC 26561]OTP77246.1 LysR family transcriptional regulator YdcI [Caballeronia sordidicola]